MFLKRFLNSGKRISSLIDVKNSKAFCMMPWVHLFISQEGNVGPCCLAPWTSDKTFGNINKETIGAIWNGAEIKKFRKKLLADKRDERCWQCYLNEKNGLRSKRKMTNFLYADKIELLDDTNSKGAVTDAKPIYWDIRFSNLCNFKCRICGHHSSSQWHSDAKQLDELSYSSKIHSGIQDFNKLFIQLVPLLNTVEEIYFAGGEPLIMAEHYQIIDALIKAGRTDVKLRYNTNFSTLNYKGSSLLERWAKFKDVFVHASLDDQNGKAELHRSGTDWSQILENRASLRQSCSHIDFMLTPTISVFNVFSLFEFHKNSVIMGFCKIDEFMPHSLKNPNYYSIQVLPEFLKLEVEQLFKQHVDWIKEYCKKCPPAPPRQDQVDKWAEHLNMLEVKSHTGHVKVDMLIEELIRSIDFMWANDTSNLIPLLIERTQKLDELRSENTFEVIPEFTRILEFNGDF